jgi:3-methyladenine DNA glycosylase Tag
LNRFGSAGPGAPARPKTPAQLRISDDRYLSTMALRVFRAGLKHSLVDAKWPAFERCSSVRPGKVVLMGAEHLERLMQDARIIRHLGKLKSVPRNAQIIWMWPGKGSFGALIADWPVTDIVGLWKYLAKHGNQLGGLSAPRFCAWSARTPSCRAMTWRGAECAEDHRQGADQPARSGDCAGAFNQWHERVGGR